MECIRPLEEPTPAEAPRSVLIVFCDTPHVRWWDRLFRTRPGFRHAYALAYDPWSQRWIIVDWRGLQLDLIVSFDFEATAMLESVHSMNGTIVEIPFRFVEGKRLPLLTYCTTQIGHLLGLKNRLILTPYRLYRILLANGGKLVYSQENPDGPIQSEDYRRAKSRAAGARGEGAPAPSG